MRPARRRFIPLAIVAALVLLTAGFFIGRASESESSETTTPAGAGEPARGESGDKERRVNTRACGDEAGPSADDVVATFPPTIVTDAAIDQQDADSPGQALLEWWQAYQFDDVVAVKALTSKATIDAIGEDKLSELVELPGPGLQGVEVLDVSETGDTAAVNAGLLNFEPEEPGGEVPTDPTNSVPETFAMVKEHGEWRFAATEFLSLKLNTLPS
jgi:hypothetical protein